MKTAQELTDKLSIALSMLCAIHCLVLPFILVILPSLAVLQLQDESFHLWMLYAVLPISIFALTMGCKKHKRYQLLAVGGTGLLLMVLAVTLGHDLLGEIGEKGLTLVGAILVATGHFLNFKSCQKLKECGCTDNKE